MCLWRFVWRADERLDLTNPQRAKSWLWERVEQWSWLPRRHWPVGPEWIDPFVRDLWNKSIKALRTLGTAAGGVPSRRPSPLSARRACEIAQRHLSHLRPVVRQSPGGGSVRLEPGRVIPGYEGGQRREEVAVGTFFVRVFASLLCPDWADDLSPVCERCGRELPLTAGGRPSRRGACLRCRVRAFRERR